MVRSVYFIKQNDHGVWVSGTIISDSSVYVISMAEDDNVRVFATVVYVDDSGLHVHTGCVAAWAYQYSLRVAKNNSVKERHTRMWGGTWYALFQTSAVIESCTRFKEMVVAGLHRRLPFAAVQAPPA